MKLNKLSLRLEICSSVKSKKPSTWNWQKTWYKKNCHYMNIFFDIKLIFDANNFCKKMYIRLPKQSNMSELQKFTRALFFFFNICKACKINLTIGFKIWAVRLSLLLKNQSYARHMQHSCWRNELYHRWFEDRVPLTATSTTAFLDSIF